MFKLLYIPEEKKVPLKKICKLCTGSSSVKMVSDLFIFNLRFKKYVRKIFVNFPHIYCFNFDRERKDKANRHIYLKFIKVKTSPDAITDNY